MRSISCDVLVLVAALVEALSKRNELSAESLCKSSCTRLLHDTRTFCGPMLSENTLVGMLCRSSTVRTSSVTGSWHGMGPESDEKLNVLHCRVLIQYEEKSPVVSGATLDLPWSFQGDIMWSCAGRRMTSPYSITMYDSTLLYVTALEQPSDLWRTSHGSN